MPQLIEDSLPIKLSLEEGTDGRTIVRGEFARADVPTKNKRVYGRKLWDREIGRLAEQIEGRRGYGELDHPSDGKTKLARVSHIITGLKVESDGRVVGTAQILGTPNGKILKALLKDGCEVGVSSRGFGSTVARQDGMQDVQEDFVLKTFDFVADPAMKTAYPQMVAEAVEFMALTEEDVREQFPELLSDLTESKAADIADKKVSEMAEGLRVAVKEELREEFERKLAEALTGVREDVAGEIREEFSNDAEIGGAKAVLSQIAALVVPFKEDADEAALRDSIKAKDLELTKVNEDLQRSNSLAKEATYRLFVEQEITGHPMAKTIRSLMSDAGKGEEKLEDVKTRLQSILTDLEPFVVARDDDEDEDEDRGGPASEEALEVARERDGLATRVESLRADLVRAVEIGEALQSKLDKAKVSLTEETKRADAAELKSYKSDKSSGFTNRSRLASLLESAASEDDVDEMVKRHGTDRVSDEGLQAMRERLQRGTPGGGDVKVLNEGEVSPNTTVMGIPMSEVMELAGIKPING